MVIQIMTPLLSSGLRPNWYSNNMEEQFKTMVRQAVQRGMNETAISTTAIDEIDAEIGTRSRSLSRRRHYP